MRDSVRDHLLGDIVAITALPSVWVGQSHAAIADSLADSLHRILHVRGIVIVLRTERGDVRAERGDIAVAKERETRIDIGPEGARGVIVLCDCTVPDDSRLVARIAANLADGALRESVLARENAVARARAIELEKHLAIGQLVAGVAHELRTPVTYANNNLHLALYRLKRESSPRVAEALPFLHEVLDAHERIVQTVNTLRRFSSPRQGPRGPLSLSDTVAEAARLFGVTHVGSVRLVQDLRAVASVDGDRVELQQVVLNLLQNAADATPPGGTITVSTRDEGVRTHLVVEDDGPGIAAEARERLFTPFYTTKPSGTGLGLSIVRRIVEAHQGTIRLADGTAGARFEVDLPVGVPRTAA